mmetsp:Transcript_65525/g.104359  ORF Transcript_65525/g.104359 Transcript_65525/m.104359 type:complete len:131 (+) Transcript_65525:1825-2217(+)
MKMPPMTLMYNKAMNQELCALKYETRSQYAMMQHRKSAPHTMVVNRVMYLTPESSGFNNGQSGSLLLHIGHSGGTSDSCSRMKSPMESAKKTQTSGYRLRWKKLVMDWNLLRRLTSVTTMQNAMKQPKPT